MDDAVQTVMTQCELWTDNYNFKEDNHVYSYINNTARNLLLVAEDSEKYNSLHVRILKEDKLWQNTN